jgi:hypothetical protein
MNCVDEKKNNNKTEKFGISLLKSTLDIKDQAYADIPRGKYIRRTIESYLGISKPKKRSGASTINEYI